MSNKYFASANILTQNQLVTWLNEAGLAQGKKKADILRKVSELLLHQMPHMIPTYIDNILSYVSDKSVEVKKQVLVFIKELSKLHPGHLSKVVNQLHGFLSDEVVAVQKSVIQTADVVYINALSWICSGGGSVQEMQYVWEQLSNLKVKLFNLVDSSNEGIRNMAIKFMEVVIFLQTEDETGKEDGVSLGKIPASLSFIDKRALEEESEHIFSRLVKLHKTQDIGSNNLMLCMLTLCSIAKRRPKYMPRVIQALADVHATLPPTLSASQMNAVRKALKVHILTFMKLPASKDLLPSLTQLLTDIGLTTQEITKAVPKEKRSKRVNELRNGDGPNKRVRIDSPQSNSQGSDRSDFTILDDSNDAKLTITEDQIFDSLNNVETVVALVMATLASNLPADMPGDFIELYKPISNSGTSIQKRNLANMLSTLVNGAISTPPPSISEFSPNIPLLKDDDEKLTLKNAVAKLQETEKLGSQIQGAVSRLMEETRQEQLKEQAKEKEKLIPPMTPTLPKLKQRVKLLKLQEITRPIPKEIKEKLMLQAVDRILKAEKDSIIGGAANVRAKLVATFASSYTPEIRDLVMAHIMDDPANRIDLALMWLYEEYSYMQGFNRHPVTLVPKFNEKHDHNYNGLLCSLITQISERGDPVMENAKDVLLRRIYLEVPVVTEEAIDYLKHLVTEETRCSLALELLEEIIVRRPPKAHKYVTALLSHAINENEEIRETAIKSVLRIYGKSSDAVKKVVEKYAKLYLGFIALNSPPMDLFDANTARMNSQHIWTDELYKLCLNLVVALFPENDEMIVEVARVYGQASADAKRCVLRVVEGPVRAVDAIPALMRMLEECPRGAETLLTRLVHIVTEKTPPTPELVSMVRDVYATRVSDVRFLIPVLNGLTKKEIIAALPKLIKLNPVVVKEVFNKLLGLQNTNEEPLPVSPSELLLTLHLVDPAKADLKYIIKATALCFAEKQTFTQEVIAVVLTKLMEEPEIPVLMMRTVLQALTLYPGLVGLVLNILQRLIDKDVWVHKVAWEGWVKCCERTAPASVGVLLALPPAPLAGCLSAAPGLASALSHHVSLLTPSQRATIAPHVLAQLVPTAVVSDHRMEPPYMPMPMSINNPLEPLPPGME